MKQTSLLQSWTKLFPSHSTNVNNQVTTVNQCSESFKSKDSDDVFLANILDKLSNIPESCNIAHKDEVCENAEFITQALERRPVLYHPTANDSEHLEGFDVDAGAEWIYPSDSSLRKYQLNIVEQCLYKNTLVCLPTGLGKTFIAAVVLYNFFRWYPTGRFVFMAPTRPLVTQQFTSCLDFIGPLKENTVELTGSIVQSKRKTLWSSYRVLFLTPQVLMNDLQTGVCPASSIRLLIFDEAHKATGNHAYCQVLRILTNSPYTHRQFRIVALSATPAADIEGVQTLIANLLISHLELRTDTSADVRPYTKHRQLETIVVPLGPELTRYHNQLVECIRFPLDRLYQRGALSQCGDLRPEKLAKYTIIKAREKWSAEMPPNVNSTESSSIQCDFGLVICLLHGLELLVQHGLRPLYRYLEGVYSGSRASPLVRSQLNKLPHMNLLWAELAQRFGLNVKCADGAWKQELIDPELPHSQAPFLAGHPKLDKLKEILLSHFNSDKKIHERSSTRVIIFTQFRDSVDEIMHMLKQLKPLIRPASFVGQGARSNGSPQLVNQRESPSLINPHLSNAQDGISQRDQMRVMDGFRSGVYNTLVSTCVGEEGIDVGQVDLIVCFDASKSPIRLMQRQGRTGRKRVGRIVVLLTEGREERNHAISIARTSSVHKALLEGAAYCKLAFYPHNPRMVPVGIHPKLHFKCLRTDNVLTDEVLQLKQPCVQKKCSREDVYRLHAESVNLHTLRIRLHPLSAGQIQCLSKFGGMGNLNSHYPTLTDMYSITSRERLTVFSETLQSSLIPSSNVGSSSSSQHLLSILRLVEMHRRSMTQLSYHALGIRKIDISRKMSELIKISSPPDSQLNLHNASQDCHDLDEMIITKTSNTPLASNVSYSIDDTIQDLRAINGLVSNKVFIDPRCSEFKGCTEQFPQLLHNMSSNRHDPITAASLQTSLNKWLETMVDQHHNSSIVPSSLKLNRRLSVEISLLEAIDTELPLPEKNSPTLKSLQTIEQLKMVPSQCTKVSSFDVRDAVQAFNLPCTMTNLARSTPFRRNCTKRSVMSSSSQVNSDEALVLLENSTIHLDASTLLDEELTKLAPSTPAKSIIFAGPHISHLGDFHKSADLFKFETKLSLGEEFSDIIKPTQITEKIDTDNNVDKLKNNYLSTISDSSFDLQINWSPVEEIAEVLGTDDFLYSSSPISLDKNEAVSRNESEKNNSFSEAVDKKSYHESLTEPTVLKHLNKKQRTRTAKYAGCKLFLSQAECTSNKSSDQLHFESQDMYEDSFIDDDNANATCDSSQSDMMKIYLQSIRSPQFFPSKVRNPWGNKRDLLKSSESTFILPQMSEQDEYQMDSFCVDDDDSFSSNEETSRHFPSKPHRKRLRTGTQIQQSFF
ncbi:Fanconi anemia group M protein isoform 1 [Schistosoma japonicum]|uniref:Fanconi anemia group M protein isoform 1 n=1 Tax=Schistosoma japonicum TaxID=6182 RepID=A0A4Z2DG70_SCHJA|nr:Fanconi anemia group M protein isoform 1 [Schistosoma japonicum]